MQILTGSWVHIFVSCILYRSTAMDLRPYVKIDRRNSVVINRMKVAAVFEENGSV